MVDPRVVRNPVVGWAVACLLIAVFGAPAARAQSARPPTLEATVHTYLGPESARPAPRALHEAGFAYTRLLIAELLPDGRSVMVEAEIAHDGVKLRYPLKLERQSGPDQPDWRVVWAPTAAYTTALVGLAGQGELAATNAGRPWSEVPRLPAFPVIVDDHAFITPYGRVSPPPAAPGASTNSSEALAPPKKLAEHAQRWIGLTLADDPGSANVDLILAAGVSWRQAIRAVMAPASLGLFRVYLVGQTNNTPSAYPAVAPVIKGQSSASKPLIVGMYPHAETLAFRMRAGDKLIAGTHKANGQACAQDMTFCASSHKDFQAAIRRQLDADHAMGPISYVMLAATGDISAERVVGYTAALTTALKLAEGKVLVGYIGKNP